MIWQASVKSCKVKGFPFVCQRLDLLVLLRTKLLTGSTLFGNEVRDRTQLPCSSTTGQLILAYLVTALRGFNPQGVPPCNRRSDGTTCI